MTAATLRRTIFASAALLTASLLVGTVGLAEQPAYTQDSLAKVKENVDAGKAIVVDVREPSEWATGHLECAVSLPKSKLSVPTELAALLKKLPKDKVIYTLCASGKRALDCGEILKQQGYHVRALKPGYRQLIEAGFEKAK